MTVPGAVVEELAVADVVVVQEGDAPVGQFASYTKIGFHVIRIYSWWIMKSVESFKSRVSNTKYCLPYITFH